MSRGNHLTLSAPRHDQFSEYHIPCIRWTYIASVGRKSGYELMRNLLNTTTSTSFPRPVYFFTNNPCDSCDSRFMTCRVLWVYKLPIHVTLLLLFRSLSSLATHLSLRFELWIAWKSCMQLKFLGGGLQNLDFEYKERTTPKQYQKRRENLSIE